MATLEYDTPFDLLRAFEMGARFLLSYHGQQKEVTAMKPGNGCVWVTAGPMLPVHIYNDGTSKDGPAIRLEAA